MKSVRNILAVILINCSLSIFGQTNQLKIMIIPSQIWMNEKGYITKYDAMGIEQTSMDYEGAFSENSEMKKVMSMLQNEMSKFGYVIRDFEQSLKALKSETDVTKIAPYLDSDVILEIYWKENIRGTQKNIDFMIRATDAYTNKQIGNLSSSTNMYSSSDHSNIEILREGILSKLEDLNKQLVLFMDDVNTNGREITLRIRTSMNWDGDLDSTFNDMELSSIIKDWLSVNTVKNRFNVKDRGRSNIQFDQVRMPIIDNNKRPIESKDWISKLKLELKTKYNVNSKIVSNGPGNIFLIIGDD